MADQIIYRLDKILSALPKSVPSIKTIAQLSEKDKPLPDSSPAPYPTLRLNSSPGTEEAKLSTAEQAASAALMRVNHSGEVCAQALYLGQAFVARDKKLAQQLYEAAEEERTHLKWCKQRLMELNAKPSLLNPVWAFGSFGIGVLAGLAGDKISLGFLAETENQVTNHLEKHLNKIAPHDTKSIAILQQMQEDEKRHATHAIALGGVVLPKPICKMMALCSKIMTTAARYM
ncbi:MAG TPA: 2-polyprenyl-3-methyl-6-methoxy-1,4-benzoquinone monooxygenase [Gammaproteobacteria bacterium]|nr:2-polyprenyl-3-methyl-6-methoxy-1,4-benzoquinone monooxygenase [Gammaproteobacteria bacterium]